MDRHLTAALPTLGLACGPAGAVTEAGAAGGALPGRRDIDIHAPQGDHRSVVFRNSVS
jgi:hypothetical protein